MRKKSIHEDLRELEYLNDEKEDDKEYQDKEKRVRKIVLASGAIFLSVLIISYVFLGFPIYGIIIGQLSSGPVRGNVLTTQGIEVIFEGNTLQESRDAWFNNPNVETTLCLHGYREGNTFVVTNTYQPTIFSQSYFQVSHEPCDDNTILMFHTHPYKSCTASEMDLYTLARAKERNPEIGMIIMCEESRFSVYT